MRCNKSYMLQNEINSNIEKLKKELYTCLSGKNLTVATAESCTGGMIGATLTSIPGISSHYGYGFVTYSNEAKQKLIDVNLQTLELYGAVSSQVAMEMAEGTLRVSGADIAVSATGIAGPGGGTAEKPVGLVYVGYAAAGKTSFKKLNLTGDRETVRKKTVENVLELILNIAENYKR